MKMAERVKYASFVENQKDIEARWDKQFGDRINELVLIGQDINEAEIRYELEECLCTGEDIRLMNAGWEFEDEWPF